MIHCIYDHPMVRQDNTEAPPASLQDLSSNISALLTPRIAALQHRSPLGTADLR